MPSHNLNNREITNNTNDSSFYNPDLSWQENIQNSTVNDTALSLEERVWEELELILSVAGRRNPQTQNWLLFDDEEVLYDFLFYDPNGGLTTVLTLDRTSELAQLLLYLEPWFYLPQ